MIDVWLLTPGTKVHYIPKGSTNADEYENGIVKSILDDNVRIFAKDNDPVVFVVFNCEGDWDNYDLYIGKLTRVAELKLGWYTESDVKLTSQKICELTTSLSEMLQEKNKRYGNSALEPLEGIKYTAEDGIKIRLVDKLKRVINSDDFRKNDIADIMGYLILLCINKGWDNFTDLID